jgi:choline dehydrogenase
MTDNTQNIFDFIIIGAGSAGCVLAERLSANGKYTVLVVEAGGTDRRFWVQMPLGYGKSFYDKSLNWGYKTTPDKGLGGRADYWPRGKVIGGSSSLNAMVWIRGDARDYDDWAAEGNPGWAFMDCLPFFKQIEDNQAGANEWRGTGGDVHISDVSHSLHPLATQFLEAGRQAGFAANKDFNGATQDGVGLYQINTKQGWRMSAAKAFLYPALKRKNVTLMRNTHALRLVLEGNRAMGVDVERGGKRETLHARREVIVSGGAVNSPQLLQLSGIGPAAHLAKIGIGLRHDLPAVGAYLQDHLGINYTYRATVPTMNEDLRPWWGKLKAGLQFLLFGRGPLSLSLNQAGGFVRTRPELPRANIQLYFQAISTYGASIGTRPLLSPDPFPGFNIGLSTCKQTSRGSIMAASADPYAAPVIEANAFGTEHDLRDMLEGVKLLRKLARQPALAPLIAEELAPGPDVVTDEQIIADFRARSGTVYHPCGTCRMGPDAQSAVVDSRLRVHGLTGLRVVDASIFPSVISGNTNAPVIMVAAKAAAMILADAQN